MTIESLYLVSYANPVRRYIAHRLAFGMFWMIIPHVAIISSLLLAGSNPNTWQGVTGYLPMEDLEANQSPDSNETPSTNSTEKSHSFAHAVAYALYKPMYPLTYQPAWIWDRGSNKDQWLMKAAEENLRLRSLKHEVLFESSATFLLVVIFPILSLLLVPTILGGTIR